MNRKKRINLLLVGIALALASVAGVFAATSDTADTGVISIESDGLDSSIDLKIATQGVSSLDDCNEEDDVPPANFIDNEVQANPVVAASPGTGTTKQICLSNIGAQTAQVSVELVETANTETGCDGDEASVDATCGTGPGELGDDVTVTIQPRTSGNCNSALQGSPITYSGVTDTAAQTLSFDLPPDTKRCMQYTATYNAGTPATEVNENQSDKVEFRFRFHGAL